MKRYPIYILCILLFSMLLFSGCQNNTVSSEVHYNKTPEFLKGVTFDKHLTVSIGFWNLQDMADETDQDDLLSYIENTFNITIKPISVNWSDYKERYQILSATKSLPDVFANLTISSSDNNDSASLANLIESRSIRSLPSDLTEFQNIDNLLKNFNYIRYSDDKFYMIPRLSFQDSILGSSDAAMLVRKDWMKNLGMSQPDSLEDFIELTSAFANKDPDGNHQQDTIGYNVNNRIALGKWLILTIAPECNVYTWVETNDGYMPSYITGNFDKVITAYRKLYETGGLDPNFYTKKSTDAVADFVHGKLGALEYKSSPASITELEAQWNLYQDKPFRDCVGLLHIFPAADGICYSNSSNMFWSETLFSSNVDDEKMERILYLFDYLLSEEGAKLTRYGLEGIDYTEENGNYKCLLDTKNSSLIKVLENKYPSLLLFNSLATWGGTWGDFEINEANNLRYGDYSMELSNEDLLWNKKNTQQVTRPYEFLLMPKESTDYFNTEKVIDDFTRVIIGKDDPLKMWDSILEGYYMNGLSDYIKRQNENYKKYKER